MNDDDLKKLFNNDKKHLEPHYVELLEIYQNMLLEMNTLTEENYKLKRLIGNLNVREVKEKRAKKVKAKAKEPVNKKKEFIKTLIGLILFVISIFIVIFIVEDVLGLDAQRIVDSLVSPPAN